ncbi:MAG: 3-oxoacyl-[acyl-carrier-protein] synthase III C-terminal domain-containing protein [Thermoleophilaceae bacterium]
MAELLTPAPMPGLDPGGLPAVESLPTVSGLATATPESSYDQTQVLELLGLAGDPFAEEIFARCGVRTRGLELSPEVLATTLQQRTSTTEEQQARLAIRAIDALAPDLDGIGVVVTANYYSLGGPTLAHRLVDHYSLRPDTDKYHLVGVGCASAVPLLRLAAQALRDRPGEQALVVASESVSGFLSPVAPGAEKTKVIGASLFGDGAAAALVAVDPRAAGPAIVATAVHQVPGTFDHVRFAVAGEDSHMQIARELPEIAEAGVPGLVDGFLARHGLDRGAIDHWPVHPGGRGILEGLQAGLGLSAEDLAPSAAVLAEHGNVGTPSAFFVLARLIADRDPRPGDLGLAVTIGPGVTVGMMLLRW